MEANSTSYEAIQLSKLLVGLFDQELDPTIICYDNQSCVNLFENLVIHGRSKQIEIKYHFIQDMVQKGVVKLHYIPIDQYLVDILTKPLEKGKV